MLMKQTLLLILTLALGIGCRNQKEYERGYENGALSTANYNYRKGDYPSYGFREYLRKRRIKLPHDEAGIDRIYIAFISKWEDYEKALQSVYLEDSLDWSNATITIEAHACIYDSCPHITISKDSVIGFKGFIFLEGKLIGSELIDTK